jgi:2-methylcitrate dehydratase PrpD
LEENVGRAAATQGATGRLAQFVVETGAGRLPDDVLHQAKRCLVDWLGVAIVGATEEGSRILARVSASLAPGGDATVVGQVGRLPVPFAALVNGFQSHVLDFDDTYNPGLTTVHGSAPVWPAVFAVGEWKRVSGRAALAAFAVGWEVQVRIARAAGRAHYDVGWHVTGTVGHFGAAAAGASLLGLDVAHVTHAFGTAGTQAAGLKQVYGSMGKAFHPGKAAMDGVLAATLAAEGFTSDDAILEGRVGFWSVLSDGAEPDRATERLGEHWELLDDGFKAYACGSLMHPTIDAVISLRREHGIDPAQVIEIAPRVHPYLSWVMAKETPRTGLDGKFSATHCAAVAMLDGAAGMAQFTDARVTSPDVVAMRDCVHFQYDDALPKDAAYVTITLADGRQLEHATSHNKGTPGNPMSDDELSAKFVDLASVVIGEDRARSLLDELWRFEAHDDIGGLVRSCAAHRGDTIR